MIDNYDDLKVDDRVEITQKVSGRLMRKTRERDADGQETIMLKIFTDGNVEFIAIDATHNEFETHVERVLPDPKPGEIWLLDDQLPALVVDVFHSENQAGVVVTRLREDGEPYCINIDVHLDDFSRRINRLTAY